jgi:phosphatidylglycerol:prolipoprotein diacylglycerol transferase
VTGVSWAVRFPFDRVGVYRHPTQLYESLSALFLLFLLAVIERAFTRAGKRPRSAILWPLFLAGYGLIRLVTDRLRGDGVFDAFLARGWALGVFLLGAAWFWVSVSSFLRARGEGGMNR